MRRVDRRTNALPTDRPTDQRTQPVIEVLCRTEKILSARIDNLSYSTGIKELVIRREAISLQLQGYEI